jgi:hypothetical protein
VQARAALRARTATVAPLAALGGRRRTPGRPLGGRWLDRGRGAWCCEALTAKLRQRVGGEGRWWSGPRTTARTALRAPDPFDGDAPTACRSAGPPLAINAWALHPWPPLSSVRSNKPRPRRSPSSPRPSPIRRRPPPRSTRRLPPAAVAPELAPNVEPAPLVASGARADARAGSRTPMHDQPGLGYTTIPRPAAGGDANQFCQAGLM